ncbi:TIGR03013 family XrtA/PEP-CTERM system glycosyltransferase [Marilutibacter aestuarii]|uniref:TIGR03013 family PEP-CTERM/XrtA system glycosyltransferase n=1 Tax=Marilutibacter aestuarii TaxID=1706195 RepID=A0A507ZSZ2_9GAMM|nr:TIGR03013 family XrtA/PEP-CTERM system glycosyltransferase [Lysobacter aestuarii]TQD40916.1 TIGR03013 family PEP-CTERM/XrtA system glycosyltransferase [Lysobacter aestuarii]
MSASMRSRKSRTLLTLWIVELALVMIAVPAAAWLRFHDDPAGHQEFAEWLWLRAFMVAMAVTGAMAAFGLYQVHVRHKWVDLILRLILSFAFGGIALLVAYYLLPAIYIGRGVLAMTLALGFGALLLVRVGLFRVLKSDALKRRVLVLGAGERADLINQRMRRQNDRQSFVVVGFLPLDGQQVVVGDGLLDAGGGTLMELVDRLQVHEIVVAADERRGAMPMEQMLACAQSGVTVTHLSTFFEREAGIVKMQVADPSWLVFSGGFDHSTPRRLSKRFFDLAAALVLLLLAWPAMLVVALCIWFESGGPIFYRQTRVGEGGKHFDLVKFRSMRTDAEADGVARWASTGDDRTTRVGRFIRLTRLDELPQLFNIIKGQMSFVGPRPERPQFVDMLDQELRYYSVRHSVKPGLTGWAQLRYPYGASVKDAEEKLKFDLFYVKNHGLVFDLMILLQTVEVVIFQRGSR